LSDSITPLSALESLLLYAVRVGLLPPEDVNYARNALLDAFGLSAPTDGYGLDDAKEIPLSEALDALNAYAAERGLIGDSPSARERFGVKLMGLLTPSPEAFRNRFETIERISGIDSACAWFNQLCVTNGYINEIAIAKNERYFAPSPYGALEITINLSKPEKDPRDIAALADIDSARETEYPACMLCLENEGYAGRPGFPARQTLRTLPIELDGERWRFQFSPYRYFPEHCIVFAETHSPMRIDVSTFRKLFDFLDRFPHYVIGSNADLPIVGGSVLNHNHFQGGKYIFPMEKADVFARATHPMYPRVRVSMLRWPMTALRLTGEDRQSIVGMAELIRTAWNKYSDPSLGVLARTNSILHNTVTPIARRLKNEYALDLVLRNNRATQEHPLGLFHPHSELHHIKKENIGLIEVMGMFILPGRLMTELNALRFALTDGKCFARHEADDPLAKHDEWISSLVKRYGCDQPSDSAERILRDALAEKCVRVLEDAGVFKQDGSGRNGFVRFLESVGFVTAQSKS
jgi:UDPglucose--hexose-1-phosphate uridylyltransferase